MTTLREDSGGEIYSQTFTSVSSVVVTHHLGYKPSVQCLDSNGAEFLPVSITHDTILQCTVVFDGSKTGTVICR